MQVSETVTLYNADCLQILPKITDGSIDAVICDPPYAEINRPYGRLGEVEWHDLMNHVVSECRRVLAPTGSAMFVLQPNSQGIGRMRPWVWDFCSKWSREWNIIQDVYWWNHTTLPQACTIKGKLCRPSVKYCVWMGPRDCYRDQDAVLRTESDGNKACRLAARAGRHYLPSGHSVDYLKASSKAVERGGVTPFNLLPIPNADSSSSSGAHGHGAGTPRQLCDWWVKYLTKPGDTILDPFHGSGTVGLSALSLGRKIVGIERDPGYYEIARKRIAASSAA